MYGASEVVHLQVENALFRLWKVVGRAESCTKGIPAWSSSLQAATCDPVVIRPANLRSWVRLPVVPPIVGAATPGPLRAKWSKVGVRPPTSPAAMVPRVDVGVCFPRPPPSRRGDLGSMSSFLAGGGPG
jgi:hypothetical protein